MTNLLKKNLFLIATMAVILASMPTLASVPCSQCEANWNACLSVANEYINGCMVSCSIYDPNPPCYQSCMDTTSAMVEVCNAGFYSCSASCTP